MPPTPVILITGHPATGKTRLAEILAHELSLPVVSKDQFKEILMDALGWSDAAWSRKLSIASMILLYRQVETLLRANVAHIAEANFNPPQANPEWQRLRQIYPLRLIQVRCEPEAEMLLARYRQRIQDASRHPGHLDQSLDPAFLEMIRRGPPGWVDVESMRISVDTTHPETIDYPALVGQIQQEMTGAERGN